jgi:hypothetical protein
MLDRIPIEVLQIIVSKARSLTEILESTELIIEDCQRGGFEESLRGLYEYLWSCDALPIWIAHFGRWGEVAGGFDTPLRGSPSRAGGEIYEDISIRVPFHKRLRKRCWHHNAEIVQHANDEDPFFDTMMDLDILLTSLHTNKLRSFR